MPHAHQYGFIVRVHRADEFPFDMLRYDEAWPASVADAAMLAKLTRRDDAEISALPRWVEVRLCSRKWGGPTVARWASFCAEARLATDDDIMAAHTLHNRPLEDLTTA